DEPLLRHGADRVRRPVRQAGARAAPLRGRADVELPRQGSALVAGDGAAAGARPARIPAALPATAQGARGDGAGRSAAGAGGRAVPDEEVLRPAPRAPPSFTAPYDHALASALARRGHEVTLLTSPFAHGDVPEPDGYAREEVFLPWSSRLLRRS